MDKIDQLKQVFDALDIRYMERAYKVSTTITLAVDDHGVCGDRNAFVDFNFDRDEDSLRVVWISRGRPGETAKELPAAPPPRKKKRFSAPARG